MKGSFVGAFHRMELLTGTESLKKLAQKSVIIFGVGGVGSWCAEALIRSGIKRLTIVDSDLICVTNINRQVQATHQTIGAVKVTELGKRLLEINPDAEVNAVQKIFSKDTEEEFDFSDFDYVIDAIDSLSNKVSLLQRAMNSPTKLFCALGASCKLDPTRIQVSSIWDSYGCRLGKLVRKRLRRRGAKGDFLCVWSDELLGGYETEWGCASDTCFCPQSPKEDQEDAMVHEWCSKKKKINGSAVHITAIYGFTLAGLVIQDIVKTEESLTCTVKAQGASV